MNEQQERNTYKYHLIQKGKVVVRSFTYDLVRREAEHQKEFPGCRIQQIGKMTTHSAAMKWEREEMRKHFGVKKKRGWLRRIKVEVASIPIKGDAYSEIIEVRVPIRFYWCPNNDFDGIEFGPFRATLLPWQEQMIDRCLEAVKSKMKAE